MAGGMDWFRWHHGSVTDPKFGLIAKRAAASVAEVLAVWAHLLEAASAADDRGNPGSIDFEALDFCLGLEEGKARCIYDRMRERTMFDAATGRLSAWEQRQPNRERDDDYSTERVRAFRARQRQKKEQGNANETPGNASSTPGTPRGEEKRQEDKAEKEPSALVADGDTYERLPNCPSEAITELYHQALPSLPRVRLMNDKRRKAFSRFWRWVLTSKKSNGDRRATNRDEALEWIAGYFGRASDNDFLMGRSGGRGAEHANWQCDLDFLFSEKGMKHVIEKTRDPT